MRVEIARQVGWDAFPIFVRNLPGDGRERFAEGGGGRSGAQHRYRTGIVLDDNVVAGAHVIQQRAKIAHRLRSRDVYHTVSHAHIIHGLVLEVC